MKNHQKSQRFQGFTDSINIKRLERETNRLLYLGFVVSITFHAALFSFISYKKTEVKAVKPIQVELIIRPPRITKPFLISKKDILKRILRKEFMMRMPSGKIKFKSPPPVEDIIKIVDHVYYAIDAKTIAEVIAELDSSFYASIKERFEKEYFISEDFGFEDKIARKPENVISLKEELLTIDDLDLGKYKGLVVKNMTDKQKIKGFVYIPIDVWGSFLRPADKTVIGLMQGFKKYTGIRVTIDPHLFIDSPVISKYPFLYISAGELFDLSSRARENLEKYFKNGGFVLLDPYDVTAYVSMRKMIKDSLGNYARINTIPDDHPIYHCFFEFDEPPVLFPPLDEESYEFMLPPDGVWLNDRLIAVIPPSPYRPFGRAWSDYESENRFENPRFRMAVNIVVYALIREGSIAKNYIDADSLTK